MSEQNFLQADNILNDLRNLLADAPNIEPGEFSLDLSGFHFDREAANARDPLSLESDNAAV